MADVMHRSLPRPKIREKEERTLPRPGSKIGSIQVLRGIAAIIVVVYHSKDVLSAGDPFKKEVDFLFNSGPAGVALFFVISGFIMVYITPENAYRPRNIYKFVVKRVSRIWPTYAVLTLTYFFIQHRFSADSHYLNDLVKSLFFIPLTNTDAPYYGYATLSVGWSLNYEIYFYLLITLSLFFGKYRWRAFFALIGITLIIIPVFMGYFTSRPDRSPDFGLNYLNIITNPVMWNFVYGVIIGLLYRNPAAFATLSDAFRANSLTLGLIALAVWQYLSGFFAGHGPLQWGFGSLCLFTAFLFYHSQKRTQFPAWLVQLGDLSFSIYLLHLPVLVGLRMVFTKLGFPVFSSGPAMLFLVVAVTLLLSSFSYKYLEIRLSETFKRLFLRLLPD